MTSTKERAEEKFEKQMDTLYHDLALADRFRIANGFGYKHRPVLLVNFNIGADVHYYVEYYPNEDSISSDDPVVQYLMQNLAKPVAVVQMVNAKESFRIILRYRSLEYFMMALEDKVGEPILV
jgi:hypothetical protein